MQKWIPLIQKAGALCVVFPFGARQAAKPEKNRAYELGWGRKPHCRNPGVENPPPKPMDFPEWDPGINLRGLGPTGGLFSAGLFSFVFSAIFAWGKDS